jgi:hypothetical protein
MIIFEYYYYYNYNNYNNYNNDNNYNNTNNIPSFIKNTPENTTLKLTTDETQTMKNELKNFFKKQLLDGNNF